LQIPIERVDFVAGDGTSHPVIGDIVELEHGFTGPNGESMGIEEISESLRKAILKDLGLK
jgi:hypothetical protein